MLKRPDNHPRIENALTARNEQDLSADPDIFHFLFSALKGCRGIVFTHGVRAGGRVGGRAAENSLSGLYLRNRKV